MPAKNDHALYLKQRSAWFAGKPGSNRFSLSLWEPSLLAMNDDAVYLVDRGA